MESSDIFRTSAFNAATKVNAPVHSEMECEQGGLFQVSTESLWVEIAFSYIKEGIKDFLPRELLGIDNLYQGKSNVSFEMKPD